MTVSFRTNPAPPMSLILSLILGLILSLLIGAAAYRRGSLTRSGILGAVITGTAIFGAGGVVPGLLLIAFFVSSSALSHYQARAKEKFSEKFQKGSRRDLAQALANGGWAAWLALAYGGLRWMGGGAALEPYLLAAFVGALATVTADTWATEIGVLSQTPPRLITTGRRVPAGTSGGITRLGTAAAGAGALFIGATFVLGAAVVSTLAPHLDLGGSLEVTMPLAFILAVGLSGLIGSLFDSLLGATVQGIYFCEYDETQTEKRIHSCGRATRRVRGWPWLDNDLVNFSASIVGSLVAAGLWTLL